MQTSRHHSAKCVKRFHWMRIKSASIAATCIAAASAAMAQSADPLSAIDWLSQTPTVTIHIAPDEPPVAEGGSTPEVSVGQLDSEGRDAVGLLPSNVTGLPNSLWQESNAKNLADLLAVQSAEAFPAMQALTYTLLLAEANPPIDVPGKHTLLLKRVDKLIALGAIEQANALLVRANPDEPDLFARWFDVTLLIGEEDRACSALEGAPHLAPSYGARVFCLARAGDWNSAAITLNSAKLLNLISEETDSLLLRFLDPELFAEEPLLVSVSEPSPLNFRLYEAIGEAQPTASLPRAYSHSDLSETAGWKSRLEAAERLARVGALPENRLFAIYTENRPAASGTVWDRANAIQRFESALASKDQTKVEQALPAAWNAMKSARLEVPFARFYAEKLSKFTLKDEVATLAGKILLLSPMYENINPTGSDDYLSALALGNPPKQSADPQKQSVSDAFHGAGVPQALSNRLARGQLGEVILQAMTLFSQGAAGDLRALTSALATFRAIGLEDTARQAALQVLLLERGY